MGCGGGGVLAKGCAVVPVAILLAATLPGARGLVGTGQDRSRARRREPGAPQARGLNSTGVAAAGGVRWFLVNDPWQPADAVAAANNGTTARMANAVAAANRTAARSRTVAATPPKFMNSAGEHEGHQKFMDRVLLAICLAVPVLIWSVVRAWELLHARGKPAPDTRTTRRPRIGSLYRLQDQGGSSMTPVGVLMQAFESDWAQGTPLENLLAGFSTALVMIPNAVSFSFVTGTTPLSAIWSCGLTTVGASLVGGRPGMVSGASAATAAALARVSASEQGGLGPMALCVFVVGLLEMFCGMVRVSRFMTLVPHPVMLGFVNGLAIMMFRSQLRHFRDPGDGQWLSHLTCIGIVVTAGISMFVATAWKRVPVCGKVVPAALASLAVATAFAFFAERMLPLRSLSHAAGEGGLRGGLDQLPPWDFPPQGVDWNDHHVVLRVLVVALHLTLVSLLESLMTEALVDQITGTSGSMRRECFGQGAGNVLAALFGLQGGCALMGHSLLNVSMGGKSRLSGLTAGLTLMLCATVMSPVLSVIPVGATVGLMSLVAVNTFAWGTFRLIMRINWIDSVVVIVVMLMTIWYDIAVAVIVGVIVSGLGFAWRIATEARVETEPGPDQRTFYLCGPLFFGSATNYRKEITPQLIIETTVVLDFSRCRILDISGIDAINSTRDQLRRSGKRVVLKGIPRDVLSFLPQDAECETLPKSEDQPPAPALYRT